MSKDDYASAFWGGKAVVEDWAYRYEQAMEREEAESAAREFFAAFRRVYPREFEELLKASPDFKAAVKMFGKESV